MGRLLFDAAAVLAILFAALMVVYRHPVKSVLALVASFGALAFCYVMLAAPFIAAIQVIVYAGAILVLFLFVLMLLNIPEETRQRGGGRPIQQILGGAAILVFTAALVALLRAHGSIPRAAAGPAESGGAIAPLARLLFTDFLLPFEALSVLLLAALVGAFVLAQPEKRA